MYNFLSCKQGSWPFLVVIVPIHILILNKVVGIQDNIATLPTSNDVKRLKSARVRQIWVSVFYFRL